MLTVAVLVSLLALVSAHGNNMMGNYNQFGHGMYRQNMGNMGNMGMGHGMNNNGMGMNNNNDMGMSQLFRYLSQMGSSNGGNMGYNMGSNMGGNVGGNMGSNMGGNMGGYTGNGQMGGRGQMGGMGSQQGMLGHVVFLLLQNLMQNKGGQDNHKEQMNKEEVEGVEGMMKKKMMMEMADMIMKHMDHKEKEAEFSKSMEYMCFMVNATYAAYKKNGVEVWNKTDDTMMENLGKQVDQMNEEEKMAFTIKMMTDEPKKYEEIFLRFATWACMSGDAYVHSAMKMEKMEKGEGECGRD